MAKTAMKQKGAKVVATAAQNDKGKAVKTAMKKQKETVARMDDKNKALCFFYRNPPNGGKKKTFTDIKKLVKKTDGVSPSISAIHEAVRTFHDEKEKVGRKEGWRKTTKEEDRAIMKTFHENRPPGHGVVARKIHKNLPTKVRRKIGKKTVIRRLAEKGYAPKKKIQKTDLGPTTMKKRLDFASKHLGKTARAWAATLQGVADFKEFTYYPAELKAKHAELRAPWTYMNQKERLQPSFVRPKRWFRQKDYRKTRKYKVFGITASTGAILALPIPTPWNSEKWANMLKRSVGPFLRKAFPRRHDFTVLFDGEPLIHAPPAKAVMKDFGINVFPDWPKYSPDINPQENVWSWAEDEHRERELKSDTFDVFKQRVLKAVRKYPGSDKLVGSMAVRMQEVVDLKGAMIGR